MTSITLARGAALSSVILLSGCLLLSACGGAPKAPSAGFAEAEPGSPVNGSAAHGPALGAAGSLPQASNARPNGSAAAQPTAKLTPVNQSIIYTASLTLRSADAMTTAKQVIAIVTAAGGYTADEHAVAGSPGRSAGTVSLTLKVPVPVYPAVLMRLSAPRLGKQIALRQQATDVTQEIANVNSLVTSQQAAITALQGLLRRAATVSELLQVQQQISADESALESLQAQQQALDHQTSYATVGMTLLSVQHAVPRKHHASHSFLSGLTAGWRALRHATTWVLTAIGVALPFAIAALILAGIGYAGRRRFTRRRAGPTAVG
jgi:hypothetical protein